MSKLRLMLIRHGLTDANATNVIQGHQPTPLNVVGLAQAKALARRLAERGPAFDLLVSSDLPRAVQTAEAIAAACRKTMTLDAAWRERGFGPWEGKQRTEDDIWRAAGGEDSPPGAEEVQAFRRRIHNALVGAAGFRDRYEAVAIVTHGGPCRMVLRMLIEGDLPLQTGAALPRLEMIANCSIMHMECADGRWRLAGVNDVAHLDGPETVADAG